MKKIVIIIATLLFLSSCAAGPQQTPVTNREEVTKDLFNEIIKFKFEEHQYIWFRSCNGGYAGYDGGIVHDPNCVCQKETVRDTVVVVYKPEEDTTSKNVYGYDW